MEEHFAVIHNILSDAWFDSLEGEWVIECVIEDPENPEELTEWELGFSDLEDVEAIFAHFQQESPNPLKLYRSDFDAVKET